MSSRVVEARREEGLYFVSFEKFGDGEQRISLKISLHFTDVRFVPPPLSRCNFRPMEAIEKSFGARPLHAFEFHAKIGIIRKPARRFSSPRPPPACHLERIRPRRRKVSLSRGTPFPVLGGRSTPRQKFFEQGTTCPRKTRPACIDSGALPSSFVSTSLDLATFRKERNRNRASHASSFNLSPFSPFNPLPFTRFEKRYFLFFPRIARLEI